MVERGGGGRQASACHQQRHEHLTNSCSVGLIRPPHTPARSVLKEVEEDEVADALAPTIPTTRAVIDSLILAVCERFPTVSVVSLMYKCRQCRHVSPLRITTKVAFQSPDGRFLTRLILSQPCRRAPLAKNTADSARSSSLPRAGVRSILCDPRMRRSFASPT